MQQNNGYEPLYSVGDFTPTEYSRLSGNEGRPALISTILYLKGIIMRKKRIKLKKRKTALIIIIAFCISIIFFIVNSLESKIQPKVKELCTYYCKMQLTQILNNSVEEVIAENNIKYSDLTVRLLDGKKISAIELRTENVNKIQSWIVKKADDKIKEKSKNEISIPVGTISDFYFFSGKGPNIKIKFLPESSVTTEINSTFSSAGINQTCHKIYIDINAETIIVLPWGSFSVDANSKCVLAESLIIGDVPDNMISGF